MGQVQLDRWSQGRVVLLGDAGYCPSPLTGLGTSLALVGAYVLAGELATARDTMTSLDDAVIRGAFEHYESRMRSYVQQAQQLPPGGANGYAPKSRLRIVVAWASMRWSQRWPIRLLMERIFKKADAIELPNYENHGAAQRKTQTGSYS
jgi:2-polyprenyl-6-methoxyphenol hydroxylase-like FAD-dependent oxidoreductase